jgi:hypothetical protein
MAKHLAKNKFRHAKLFMPAIATVLVAIITPLISNSATAGTPEPSINLGSASAFAVLAGSAITNTGPTTATGTAGGDMGSDPTPAFTGFGSIDTVGTKYVVGSPGIAAVATAKADLLLAYNQAVALTPTNFVTADLGGQTLTSGVYNSAASIGLTGTVTLDAQNNPEAVFVFQAGSTVLATAGSSVQLINGAQACHVFWQVGSSATFGAASNFAGHVLAYTAITTGAGATFRGSLLASNAAVTIDSNTFVNDACLAPAVIAPVVSPSPVVTPTPTATATATATASVTPTPSESPTQTASSSPTPTQTPAPTLVPEATPEVVTPPVVVFPPVAVPPVVEVTAAPPTPTPSPSQSPSLLAAPIHGFNGGDTSRPLDSGFPWANVLVPALGVVFLGSSTALFRSLSRRPVRLVRRQG